MRAKYTIIIGMVLFALMIPFNGSWLSDRAVSSDLVYFALVILSQALHVFGALFIAYGVERLIRPRGKGARILIFIVLTISAYVIGEVVQYIPVGS